MITLIYYPTPYPMVNKQTATYGFSQVTKHRPIVTTILKKNPLKFYLFIHYLIIYSKLLAYQNH